jgi:hypothetical protein
VIVDAADAFFIADVTDVSVCILRRRANVPSKAQSVLWQIFIPIPIMEFFMNDSSFLHISSWAEFSELLPVVAPYVETCL